MEAQSGKFDLIIIGSGPGGYLSAILSAQKGLSVAVIEKAELGGTCLNRGCIPTKALLKEAMLYDTFKKEKIIGSEADPTHYFQKALDKKTIAVDQVVSGLKNLLNRDRITLIQGEAFFIDPRTIRIRREGDVTETIQSNRILIATGAVPRESPNLKTDGQYILGSDDVLKMKDLPSTMAIVGGGRRGIEFATFFNIFGVQVTLFEKENRILPQFDREISIRYRGLLTKRGIKLSTESEVVSAERLRERGPLNLKVAQKGKEQKMEFEKMLMVGERSGNIEGLQIEKASLTLRDGFIPVDVHMKTPTSGVYAVGDIVGQGFLAHKASHEAKIAVENILGKESQKETHLIPSCLYSSPEAASVGLTEEEALKEYQEVTVGKFPFMACGKSIATGNQEGMVKIISEKKYGEVLGVHILGPRATDLIHLGAMAIKHEIGVEGIKEMIFAHPTFAEAFFEAALDSSDQAIHMMKG